MSGGNVVTILGRAFTACQDHRTEQPRPHARLAQPTGGNHMYR